MKLSVDRVESYIDLVALHLDEQARISRVQEMRKRLHSGQLAPEDYRVLTDSRGRVCAAIGLQALGVGSYRLNGLRTGANPSASERQNAAALVCEAMRRATQLQPTSIDHAVFDEWLFPEYEEQLKRCGFARLGRRLEYKTEISELPSEGPSPLTWRSLGEVSWDDTVALLAAVSEGDPDPRVHQAPEAALTDFLTAFGTTTDNDCVSIGFLQGQSVAFVLSQIEISTGWSTLAYVGVIPSLRGCGLGTRTHLHGISQLRKRGGRTYRGGAFTENTAMLRVFEANGCRAFATSALFRWYPLGGA